MAGAHFSPSWALRWLWKAALRTSGAGLSACWLGAFLSPSLAERFYSRPFPTPMSARLTSAFDGVVEEIITIFIFFFSGPSLNGLKSF